MCPGLCFDLGITTCILTTLRNADARTRQRWDQCRPLKPGARLSLSIPTARVCYAVALCCSGAPSLTLTTFDTPGSCMVTP